MAMLASLRTAMRRMAFGAALGAMVPAVSLAAPGLADGPTLQCQASIGASSIAWTVELDHAVPLATVDSEDTPAEYANGHVSIRLAASGPNLFIGLHSGRLLVTAADGRALGRGLCRPLMSVATGSGVPLAALSVPAALFPLSAA